MEDKPTSLTSEVLTQLRGREVRNLLKFVPMARLQSPGQVKPGGICCHLCLPQTPWQLGSIGIHWDPLGSIPWGFFHSTGLCVFLFWDHTGLDVAEGSGVCVRMWTGVGNGFVGNF